MGGAAGRSGGRRGRGVIAVFSSYLLAFALLTLPWFLAAPHAVPTASPRAGDDTRNLTWVLWWVAGSLQRGLAGVFDTPINYPAKGQLTGSEHFATIQVLFLPLYEATGNPFLAMKMVLFLSYPLAGLAMNRLLVALGFTPLVAWVMGFAYALGALQVPASVYLLHALAVFPPTIAWTLHRLRESTDARHAIPFGLAFLLGAFAAYYTAAILLVVIALWGIGELSRPLPGRGRFVALVAGIVLLCLALLATASLPYLSRSEVADPTGAVEKLVRDLSEAWTVFVLRAPAERLGGVSLALGLVGCLGLLDREFRRLTVLAVALVAASAFLMSGGPLRFAALVPESPVSALLTLPVRFFRIAVRFASITGLGLALLGAIALQLASRRSPRPVALAIAGAVVVAVAWERGTVLFHQELETSKAFTTDAAIYRRVARISAREGAGPLLELPLWTKGASLQPEAMIGHMWHRMPLVTGHTGYSPPQRRVIDEAIARLPSQAALQDLEDMTRLRWILIRPAADWGSKENRDRFVRGLLRLRGAGRPWRLGRWLLVAVHLRSAHPLWHDVLAKGPKPGRTLLGTPLAPLDPGKVASLLSLRGPFARNPRLAAVGLPFFLSVHLENQGEQAWPATGAAATPLPFEVVLVARWKRVDSDAQEGVPEVARIRLPRDVPRHEGLGMNVAIVAPGVPGHYLLTLSLEQLGGASFAGARNPPLALLVEMKVGVPTDARTSPGRPPISSSAAPRAAAETVPSNPSGPPG